MALFIVVLSGCEQATSKQSEDSNPFVGTWKAEGEGTYPPDHPIHSNEKAYVTETYSFNKDKTFTEAKTNSLYPGVVSNETGTYTFNTEKITLVYDNRDPESNPQPFSYRFENGKFYLRSTEFTRQ